MFTKEEIYATYSKLEQPNIDAEEVYNGLVSNATADLDALLQDIYTQVVLPDDVPFEIVAKLYTKLTNYIYFIGERLEKIGLQMDIAKQSLNESYNDAYNNNLIGSDGKKRTAAELSSIASNASMAESVLNDIYTRAYKTVKFKVDSAQGMANTLSRVFSKKMQEMSFTAEYDKSRLLME